MSPYAEELAHARLEALRQLIDAMREAEDPAEKRRCAVAIFNAPDPCELDDEIELEDDDESTDDHTSAISESVGEASESRGYLETITPEPPSSVPHGPSVRSPSSPPVPAFDISPHLRTSHMPHLARAGAAP